MRTRPIGPATARWAATALAAAVVAVLAWAEAVSWRASRRRLGPGVTAPRSEAVVVLGFGNPGRRANIVNRYRVRAGIRSRDPRVPGSVLVLCGGPVRSFLPEADVMAGCARASGYRGPIERERRSTTTWENIVGAIPFLEDAEAIKIVSDPVHAEKGRLYLGMLRPDLAARLIRGREYRFGELTWLKPVAAVAGLIGLRRARRGDV